MKIIDTFNNILILLEEMDFQFDENLWRTYAEKISVEFPDKCKNDSNSYDFQKDILPVLEASINNASKMKKAHDSFIHATKELRERFVEVFSVEPQVDIIFYLGLCNGSGWVTKLDNKSVILLGIEKIVELDWCDTDSMIALIYHELGHIWHGEVGVLYADTKSTSEKSIWQLYQEGIAMYCEQLLLNDFTHYHQNKGGWLEWCDRNRKELFIEYKRRIDTNESTQDFFGDWCSYKGHSDIGYYLGCELIKSIAYKYTLEELANLKIDDIYSALCNCIA